MKSDCNNVTSNIPVQGISNNSTLAPNYRPRYSFDETSPFISENRAHLRQNQNFCCSSCCQSCCCIRCWWWPSCISLRCLFSVCCGSRRRVSIFIIFTIIICIAINRFLIEPLLDVVVSTKKFALAKRQSYGFFDDIPQSRWNLLRKRVKEQRKREMKLVKKMERGRDKYALAADFYQSHWQADFTCPHERRVGGTQRGSKWVCNPHSIAAASSDRVRNGGNGCLVYTSSGSLNGYKFESALLDIIAGSKTSSASSCEVHVFYPARGQKLSPSNAQVPNGVYLHPWGFKATDDHDERKNNEGEFKSMQDTVRLLGHEGKTIDLLMIDCEGCEWDVFRDWFDNSNGGSTGVGINGNNYLNPIFMQILVEVHGSPPHVVNDFFQTIQKKGYVTFHKEPILEARGNAQEYAFLKLTPDFFQR